MLSVTVDVPVLVLVPVRRAFGVVDEARSFMPSFAFCSAPS